jgi:hypothetical protein
MNKLIMAGMLTLALVAPFAVAAEEQEKQSDTFIYATYFYCDTARQDEVDELVKNNTAKFYDAAVADGTITGWGWLRHHTGGKWRRIQYHAAGSLEALLAAQDIISGRIEKAGLANDGFAAICNAHDDYIWKAEAGNSLQSDRGSAGLSVYEECDITREDRALEIAKSTFAPVLDKAVADGKIKSWGYNSHVLGGQYRALQTMTGADFASLLKARGEILDAIYGDGDNALANEYSSICGSHSDYLWEFVH